ncbi:hypothetical protein [Micromonospora zhanjiangensis]|uniref:Uncharacterized protein n=1 Tax=Micromonospora zhanjiangensis TaxID=1522057 RepID=A0ABV8KJI7_9ACTN
MPPPLRRPGGTRCRAGWRLPGPAGSTRGRWPPANGFFTNGDGARFAHELGITLVDRRLLEAWTYCRRP